MDEKCEFCGKTDETLDRLANGSLICEDCHDELIWGGVEEFGI